MKKKLAFLDFGAWSMLRLSERSKRGNMLPLIAVVTATVVVALVFFCFKMTRIMGGYQEQRTAIEAAALAAAKDMSSIVVPVPNVGYVGLSDAAPNGTSVSAPDGYAMPVIGINTLLATVRLDMAVADIFKDSLWRQRAAQDYNNAILAQKTLVAQLQVAASGGSGVDINGKTINPVQDAITAYNANLGKMQGMTGATSTTLVSGSMKITLGCIPPTTTAGAPFQSLTNTPVPQNGGLATVPANLEQNGNYIPFTNVPYASNGPAGTANFVFAGCGSNVMLCDPTLFTTVAPGLPSQSLLIPSIIKVDADQQFIDKDQEGHSLNRTIHIAGAAQSSCNFDPRPNPGVLSFSFPNGVPPEITNPLFLFSDPAHVVNYSPCDQIGFAPGNGDYPENALLLNASAPSIPYWSGFNTRITGPLNLALYDWIRRGGATVNVQALSNWFSNNSFTATLTPTMYVSEFAPTTNAQGFMTSVINTSMQTGVPTILSRRVSSNQWIAIAGGALKSSNGYYYDLIIKDNVYNEGIGAGGYHGGEPLGNQLPAPPSPGMNPSGGSGPTSNKQIDQPPPAGGEYPYNSGFGVRPTYLTPGQAVDIRFRGTGFPYSNIPPGYLPL